MIWFLPHSWDAAEKKEKRNIQSQVPGIGTSKGGGMGWVTYGTLVPASMDLPDLTIA